MDADLRPSTSGAYRDVRHQMVPVCFCTAEVQQTSPYLDYPSTASLSVWTHCAIDDSADAKKILTALPPEDWKRPLGCPRITWMKTVLSVLESHNLTMTEAVSMVQNSRSGGC